MAKKFLTKKGKVPKYVRVVQNSNSIPKGKVSKVVAVEEENGRVLLDLERGWYENGYPVNIKHVIPADKDEFLNPDDYES